MKYPLEEKIGAADLLVGRKKEFERFDKWIDRIPRKLAKSRVILARRKNGKPPLCNASSIASGAKTGR